MQNLFVVTEGQTTQQLIHVQFDIVWMQSARVQLEVFRQVGLLQCGPCPLFFGKMELSHHILEDEYQFVTFVYDLVQQHNIRMLETFE